MPIVFFLQVMIMQSTSTGMLSREHAHNIRVAKRPIAEGERKGEKALNRKAEINIIVNEKRKCYSRLRHSTDQTANLRLAYT